jgi:cytochrome oxidase assembly protein ShyY1
MQGFKINNFIFKPSLLPSIVTALLIYIMISLGLWQLDRAEYKANLQSIIETRSQQAAVNIDKINTQDEQENWLYQPVSVNGQYDNQHNLLLDNQVHDMQAGYHVYTPFKLTKDTAILVNRGWVKQTASRQQLPPIPVIEETMRLDGYLNSEPYTGISLGTQQQAYSNFPAIAQSIDLKRLQNKLDYRLLPVILVINQPQQSAFTIQPIKINMNSEKHQAYAFQWFALCVALLVIYITVNSKRIPQQTDSKENEQ